MAQYNYNCVTEVICNDNNIFPAMKELIEAENMNPNQASIFIEEDSDGKVTRGRALMVWQRRKPDLTCVKNDKPIKKHTKPEVKIQLDVVVKAFKQDEIIEMLTELWIAREKLNQERERDASGQLKR